jgi:hypothetical protein
MNVSFLLAGTLRTNPILFILATWIVLAWKNAGWYGLEHWALPFLGMHGQDEIKINQRSFGIPMLHDNEKPWTAGRFASCSTLCGWSDDRA